MKDCNNCKHCRGYDDPCYLCTDLMTGDPTNWEPLTHADHIRAMTDEELAEWINKHDCHTSLYGYDPKEAILDWLRQEVQNAIN